LAGVRIYRTRHGFYIGVDPLKLDELAAGTAFTIVLPPEPDAWTELERVWRRERWRVVMAVDGQHKGYELVDSAPLDAEQITYFESLK